MPVKIWVGRFAIVDGQPQEEGPFLRSYPRQRPDEEEDELYVLVEPASPASREHCAQLAEAIGQMYRQDILSITGAVSRALRAAHQQLHDWNERTLREQRAGAGVTTLAIRDRTAYLAQVGPAVAFHVGDGHFSRVVPAEGAKEPLGQEELIEPLFNRYELSPGDLLLVASPRIDELIPEASLRDILLRGGDEALVELFRLARDQQEFALVLLACVVEPESGAPQTAPASPFDVSVPEPASPFGAAEAAPEAEAQPGAPEPEPELMAPSLPAATRAPEAEQAEPPPGLTQPKVRLKGAESDIRYRRTTGMTDSMPRIPPFVIIGAIVLAVLGLIGWLVLPDVFKESKQDRYDSLVSDARSSINRALATDDPNERREALRAADTALAEAETIRPGDAELVALRQQLDAELARINAVIELPELDLVVDVSEQIPGSVSSRDLAIGGGGAYFLDRSTPRVIAVTLLVANPEPFVLFEGGDLVGAEITGAPQHIAWAEDQISLLIMDDARRLIAVRPPEPGQLQTVRDAAAWGSADGMAYAGGSLYILDRSGDQVWRYPPTESGFDSEREALLSNFDLEQASEVAVADALYLVVGETRIVRVAAGQLQEFTQAGIDRPLSAPGSLVPLPNSNRLLVADRGNNRIAVFALDGTFLQQWTSPTFADMRAIAVDEPNNLLYVLVGGALYRTALPAAP